MDVRVISEVVVKLANGWSIRSGVYDRNPNVILKCLNSGEYMRLVDPKGAEYLYLDSQEWQDSPVTAMGAFINAASGVHLKEKLECGPGCDECSNCPGYRYVRKT